MKRYFERSTRSLSIAGAAAVALLITFSFSGCLKRGRKTQGASSQAARERANETQSPASAPSVSREPSAKININTASAKELEKLPGIGKSLAERIVEHREKYGPFRRPEHLIVVRGISDTRFRALRDLITVD